MTDEAIYITKPTELDVVHAVLRCRPPDGRGQLVVGFYRDCDSREVPPELVVEGTPEDVTCGCCKAEQEVWG